jgi:hypothetical protein
VIRRSAIALVLAIVLPACAIVRVTPLVTADARDMVRSLRTYPPRQLVRSVR